MRDVHGTRAARVRVKEALFIELEFQRETWLIQNSETFFIYQGSWLGNLYVFLCINIQILHKIIEI